MKPRREIAASLDEILERWIGYALPPAGRALEEASFAPDEPDAYCARCGDSVAPGEASATGCGSCRGSPPVADAVIRLGPYADELRRWILLVKFDRWAEMGHALGRMLGEQVRASGRIDPRRAVIVPIPMPLGRRLYRGIDHTRVIARGMRRSLRAPIVPILARRPGPPQVTLPASMRRRRGGKGLRVRQRLGGWPLSGWHVLLVDDVRTTGASLRGAARRLRRLRPERIVACVLAVADPPTRRHDRHGSLRGSRQNLEEPGVVREDDAAARDGPARGSGNGRTTSDRKRDRFVS